MAMDSTHPRINEKQKGTGPELERSKMKRKPEQYHMDLLERTVERMCEFAGSVEGNDYKQACLKTTGVYSPRVLEPKIGRKGPQRWFLLNIFCQVYTMSLSKVLLPMVFLVSTFIM